MKNRIKAYGLWLMAYRKLPGFSALEVILAGSLFVILTAGISGAVVQGISINKLGSEQVIATQYASEGLDAVRSIRDRGFSNLNVTNAPRSVSRSGTLWTLGADNTQDTIVHNTTDSYIRRITIDNVYRSGTSPNGNIVSSGGTLDPLTKKVTATVTWNFTSSRPQSISLVSYLSDWGATIMPTLTPTVPPTATPVPPTVTPTPTTPPPTSTPVPTSIPTYTITGTVYIDTNSNGVQDAGEVGYNAATVTRTTGVTTTTNTSGVYTFSGVQAGTYTITLTVPAGYSATTTNPVSISVTTNTTRNFGIALTPTNTPIPPTNTPVPPTPTRTPTPTLTPTPTPPWPNRKRITINRTQIPGVTSLSGFPVLISITGDTQIGARSSNGTDIKFTSSDGVTKLAHELESYSETSGAATLVAWVLVPTVNGASAASDTFIYMYYGNTSGVDQQATCTSATTPTNCVWDANYKAVWHMRDSGTTTVDDITANNKVGSKLTATEPNPSTGIMSGAQAFDGSNDRVIVASPNLPTGDFTYSAWVNLTSTTNEQLFMSSDQSGDEEVNIAIVSGKVEVTLDGTGADLQSTSSVTTGGWRYIVVKRSAGVLNAYINGVKDATSASESNTLDFKGCQLIIGAFVSPSTCTTTLSNFVSGTIDEVRISNSGRPDAWISAEYNNQMNPSAFYVVGTQEAL